MIFPTPFRNPSCIVDSLQLLLFVIVIAAICRFPWRKQREFRYLTRARQDSEGKAWDAKGNITDRWAVMVEVRKGKREKTAGQEPRRPGVNSILSLQNERHHKARIPAWPQKKEKNRPQGHRAALPFLFTWYHKRSFINGLAFDLSRSWRRVLLRTPVY